MSGGASIRKRETIFALSSGAGRAAIAVIRISGPDAGPTLETLTRQELPVPRAAHLSRIINPLDGTPLDRGLVIWFAGPASATGEDLVELHLHGGPAVVAGVLEALGGLSGLRPAEPGEFSRRAFHNEKLDLTALEGLSDLIAAETASQRRQALRQMECGLARRIRLWRERLIGLLAHLEAEIDFVEEEDLQLDSSTVLQRALDGLAEEIEAALADQGRGERLREGYSVAILGPPNAGKSTLLNALAQREAAIVSETAGTTRDVIEVHLELEGLPLLLADTAGLRSLEDLAGEQSSVEAEGIRRARSRAGQADLRLLVLDLTAAESLDRSLEAMMCPGDILIGNKADRVEGDPALRLEALRQNLGLGEAGLVLSALKGDGLDRLIDRLVAAAAAALGASGEAPLITRARHRAALEEVSASLRRALRHGESELVAEELRLALRALGRVTGQVDVEEVLDVLFREFCIGK